MWLRVVRGLGGCAKGPKGVSGLGPGKGQAGRRGLGGALAHVLVGGQGNNEAFGDCEGSTSSFPVCPLCGLDPGGGLGAGLGALNGPLVSALGVGQAPPGTQCPRQAWPASVASTLLWLRTGPVGEGGPLLDSLAGLLPLAAEAGREEDPI